MCQYGLSEISDFPSLVKFLSQTLDWPVELDNFEDNEDLADELSYDYLYNSEELGIPKELQAKILQLRQMVPLVNNQPWTVFYIEFESKRLPIMALRRILNVFVTKKRASNSDRATWKMQDLLFVNSHGMKENRAMTFAHFTPPETGYTAVMREFMWDREETHLSHIERYIESLKWPDAGVTQKDWRAQWRRAFVGSKRKAIRDSKELAEEMAFFAKNIRTRVADLLNMSPEVYSPHLYHLYNAFKKLLIHDLKMDDFADTYAQTMTYGMFAARTAKPNDDFNLKKAPERVPPTNPFLRSLFRQCFGLSNIGGGRIDVDEIGLQRLVELFESISSEDINRILDEFGSQTGDPVIHFYEHFLANYDSNKRVKRGVFYTPKSVVTFIVKSVDELLRDEYHLIDGLADTATWKEMSERFENLIIPNNVNPNQHFIQILDPSTGTGTFLVEVIDLIYKSMRTKWENAGKKITEINTLWNEYVPTHLLPRLYGYELLMAPYSIAHMKIGLKLVETGYLFNSSERVRVYLTNSLEPATKLGQLSLNDVLPALATEATAVNEIKDNQLFTVVIGNPPYSNYSANLSEPVRKIVDKYRFFKGQQIRERNQLQFERNIQDDYVKFISIGEDFILSSGIGVLSYITNGTMLASNSLRGMREQLHKSFNSIFELNLHGGVNERVVGNQNDENVFEISQSVAIHLYSYSINKVSSNVKYCSLKGTRSNKYKLLSELTPNNIIWQNIIPDDENFGFIPQDKSAIKTNIRLDSLFVQYGAGIKTNRDAIAIAFNKESLLDTVKNYDSHFKKRNDSNAFIIPILYRPYDSRFIFYHKKIIASRSLPTMQHFVGKSNIGIIASSTWTSPDRFSVNISDKVIEMKTGTHDRGTTFFPLYTYEGLIGQNSKRTHNFKPSFINEWEEITKTIFSCEQENNDIDTTSPEDILNWLYGLFHSPKYRANLKSSLAQGFPIVLIPKKKELRIKIAAIGEELINIHLFKSSRFNNNISSIIGSGVFQVEKVNYSENIIWINKSKTQGFKNISQEIWDFHVGGYPVCQKWLKDRQPKKGKAPRPGIVLTNKDINHYQYIVFAISETISIMKKIDKIIDEHGGWPDAFE